MKTKIFAFYLPQYHQIPENNQFWGEGFTDWKTVQNAKPLYQGNYQPRIPMNSNYYDLSEKDAIEWQSKLARKYGIEGFGIYHYWFNDNKNLLTKPAEIIHENKDIDIDYFFAWDNISWKRSWSNVTGNDWSPVSDNDIKGKGQQETQSGILIPYILGGKASWRKHFMWLLPHFMDKRYVKVDGKPMFVIYHCSEDILEMCRYWNELAQEHGFKGMHIIYRQGINTALTKGQNIFYYEPSASSWDWLPFKIYRKLLKTLNIKYGPKFFDYDKVWKRIIKTMASHPEPSLVPSAFVGYDDTPRRGKYGTVIKGQTPEKFSQYLKQLLEVTERQQKPYLFLTAWNEWSEGAYLEPDQKWGYAYLEAI